MTITAPRQLLRLATAGSVDDGKSTLIGRLLHDTGSLPIDHLDAVTDENGNADLAALSDGLRAEREQGITIDVAYRFFSTASRSFVLADTPGHERYTRNMFTGTSNAHVAMLLVDARTGVLRQTRRHARIAELLAVPHVVAVVNKIDLVGFDEARFREVESDLRILAGHLGAADLTVIPVSATLGDNVVHRSTTTPWYAGPTLLEYLESVELAAPSANTAQLRLPVQWVARPTEGRRRRYTGRLSAGTLTVGDEVVVLPAGARSTVTALDTLDPERSVAVAPLSVSLELADDIDVARGDLIVSAHADASAPVPAREIDATVCWLGETPLRASDRIAVKHTSRTVRATVQALHTRLDPETLDEHDSPAELALNDIGRITLRTSTVVLADTYAENRDGGAFILIDESSNDTIGAGTVLDSREVVPGAQTRRDITWHPSSLDRGRRWAATGQRGATIWLTGLPASGKSTVAVALERTLVDAGRTAYLLDGDNVRHGISDDLGFSPGDRAENIRRVGHLTRLFADAGVVAIASMVSPLRSDRTIARVLNEAAGLPFLEIHVSTPVEECERRDPKGLYARARAGELRGLTGVDAPYEEPDDPDLAFDTTGADLDELVQRILAVLARHEVR
ncbi:MULTISPECIES: adenylyl-sulfate kinase [Rhodococcus]|uniref:Adenylyl-sulfate kinase n=1 Tax=Rhodococcus oxybenzonivorans TaxID=1990687 RepID=A0AAE5A4G7_9NOCA|nr:MULTISPECIES: adenylyl-sulfate kinase [Rhodococcus]MDV7244345.1 adenylyl-sulfate kinase [Rhodococcus oxybenzonivorans]MDV7263496.1 adenylyl-sulfate kinase [Rhodococcus oxybenzonivorans]MDV7274412.1 adenylyl-sulfate kinase [Rhodococcus oxybenzonivorans]MDV7335725.1 adenylyl-sulfate kinase [Rhodococcus oxybenzonivorans]MDV7345362.1 adenylyl-sulfate kinase [Rhodococcus oxybenzonivorans]